MSQNIEAQEDDTEIVDIILKEDSLFSGRLVTPSGSGVPGVQIIAIPEEGGIANSTTSPQAMTDNEGKFEIEFPSGTDSATLYFYPPGWPFHVQKVRTGDPITINLFRESGTITISELSDIEHYRSILLIKDDLIIPLGYLGSWSLIQNAEFKLPGDMIIPQMPLGNYTICKLLSRSPSDILNPSKRICGRTNFLSPSGELVLNAPRE